MQFCQPNNAILDIFAKALIADFNILSGICLFLLFSAIIYDYYFTQSFFKEMDGYKKMFSFFSEVIQIFS